jgi:methyltransferase
VIALFLALVFVPMIVEARLASRHERDLRAQGAIEPAGDVYQVMTVAYPACFVAMLAEGWLRGVERDAVMAAGLAVFVFGKALKYWAIATLGPRWTFRVLVPPGSAPTVAGPYRFLNHPNYAGVVCELVGVGLMSRAAIAGVASVLGFGALMAARIRVEERALRGTR